MIDVVGILFLFIGIVVLLAYLARVHLENKQIKDSAMVRETIKESVLSEPLVTDEIREKSHEMRGQSQRLRAAMTILSRQPNPIEAFIRAIHPINGHENRMPYDRSR